jgi:hypothetical protein
MESKLKTKRVRLRNLITEIDRAQGALYAMGALVQETMPKEGHPLFGPGGAHWVFSLIEEQRHLIEELGDRVGFYEVDKGDIVQTRLQRVLGSPEGEEMGKRLIRIKHELRFRLVTWEDGLTTEFADRLPAGDETTRMRTFCQMVKAFYYQAQTVALLIDGIKPFYYLNFWDFGGFHYTGELESKGQEK